MFGTALAKRLLQSIPPFSRWIDGLNRENRALRERTIALEKEVHEARGDMDRIRKEVGTEKLWAPAGHFYSPIPAMRDLKASANEIFDPPAAIRGVHLHHDQQLERLRRFAAFYPEQPFKDQKAPDRRYFFDNPNYSYGDAITLYCLMRDVKPRRIIEVGSGYSSCAMLDVNELFFDNAIDFTFVEPYPQLLRGLLTEADRRRVRIVARRLQDADPRIFRELQAGDMLFIDSSHVAKTGSDVNYLMFKVLPLLNAGVYVHFHDIFYPFEYPSEWVFDGRAWNEAYVLRAFLQYNRAFQIEFFSSYLMRAHREIFAASLPLYLRNAGGAIWLRKTEQDPALDRVDACVEPKAKALPERVEPGLPESLWVMGEGWHGGETFWGNADGKETSFCWMAGKASLEMAGPQSREPHLRILGYSPHTNGATLTVSVDSIALAPTHFSGKGPVDASIALPASLIGRPAIHVQLEVDRTYLAPNDPRTLGLMIMEIAVR